MTTYIVKKTRGDSDDVSLVSSDIPWSFDGTKTLDDKPYIDSRAYTSTDLSDNTAGLQEAIDAGYSGNKKVYFVEPYTANNLRFYPGSVLEFNAGAILTMSNGSTGFVLRTSTSPSVVVPTSAVERAILIRPQIDCAQRADVGIFLEAAQECTLYDVYITRVKNSTFSYCDYPVSGGYGTYQTCGICIKGNSNISTGAYYNKIYGCYIRAASSTDRGGCGIVFTSTSSASGSKANFNKVHNPRLRWMTRGLFFENGDNNLVEAPELSNCTTGIDDDSTNNMVVKPFMENCTTGNDESGATNQFIIGTGGIVGTTAISTASGTRNTWFSGRGGLRVIYAPTDDDENTGADLDRVNAIRSFSHMNFYTRDSGGDDERRIQLVSGTDDSVFNLDWNTTLANKTRLRMGRRSSDPYSLSTVITAGAAYAGDMVWVEPQSRSTVASSAPMYCHTDYIDAAPVYRWVPLVPPGTNVYNTVAYAREAQSGAAYTNIGAGGTLVINLCVAKRGVRFTFINVEGNAFRVNPDGTEVIRGGGAGKYAYIDAAGESFTLIATGDTTTHWEVMSHNGATIHFEA